MTFTGKLFAIVMLPLGILIILEAIGIFSLELPFDKVLLGAILMMGLQVLNLILIRAHNSPLRFINLLMLIIFTAPVIVYFVSGFLGSFVQKYIPLIIGVMMLVEALYALH